MRGKAGNPAKCRRCPRITPAYAGKSFCDQLGVQVRRDHPRLCGEKVCRLMQLRSSTGSPPPMRGKELHSCRDQQRDRITPAYAGKS